eukprot:scpid52422/ scgid15743/ Peptidase inhibitor 16; Cysteine-rich protease inhibitor
MATSRQWLLLSMLVLASFLAPTEGRGVRKAEHAKEILSRGSQGLMGRVSKRSAQENRILYPDGAKVLDMENTIDLAVVAAPDNAAAAAAVHSAVNVPFHAVTSQEAQIFLNAHNTARRDVQPPPCKPLPEMSWDSTLARVAQDYADKCRWAHNPDPASDAGGEFSSVGENLFISTSIKPDFESAVKAWVSEKVDYDYDTNSCRPGKVCGHYTQVVWDSSVKVGCGAAACDAQDTYQFPFDSAVFSKALIVVCNYAPAGNFINQRPYEATCPTVPPMAAATGTAFNGAQIADMLAAHNEIRLQVSPKACPALAPMVWDATLATVAQNFADTCRFQGNPNRVAQTNGKYVSVGENQLFIIGSSPVYGWVARHWAQEAAYYDYSTDTCSAGRSCSRYEQIVWSASTKVGCGIKECTPSNSPSYPFPPTDYPAVKVIVCNYAPSASPGIKPYTAC